MKALCSVVCLFVFAGVAWGAEALDWEELPPVPGGMGFGGPFVGSHHGALIVAGGANFPEAPPWENGAKVYYDDIYVLEKGDAQWRRAGALGRPMAYGAAVSTEMGVVLIGGGDGNAVSANVSLLRWDPLEKALEVTAMPPLPATSWYNGAALIGNTIYVVAGQREVDPVSDNHAFWALDLDAEWEWRELPVWPGPPRKKMLTAAQSPGGTQTMFYLFSGEVSSRASGAGLEEYQQEYLKDGYRFDPAKGEWKALAEMPVALAAGCAIAAGQSHVLVFSGSAGEHIHKPVQDRPEFGPEVYAYHTITDTWVVADAMPRSVVTTGVTEWDGGYVIASGEIAPGVRTPRVQVARLKAAENRFGVANTVVLVVYLGLLVGVGWYFSRREKTTKDYFLAGRRIPWWAAGLSIYATQLSAITFVGSPAVAYATNWLVYPGKFAILLMAPIVICFYLPFFRRLDITTAYEYLERRFNVAARLFGSASFILFQVSRMAVVVYLPALALTAITGMNVYVCILTMGILSIVYTVLGGMEAVVWTDVVQTVVLWGGMLAAVIAILIVEGGPGAIVEVGLADDKFAMWDGRFSFTEMVTWSMLLGTFMLQLAPYTTDQAVVQRYLTTRDEKAAAKSIWTNGLLTIPFSFLFFALGICLYGFFKSHPELLLVGMKNDQVFPLFVSTQLPAGVSGLVIAGVFAAAMSSLDSSMHSVSTAYTVDFHRKFRPGMSDAAELRLARAVVMIVGVLGVGFACLLAGFSIGSLWFFFQKLVGLLTSGLVGLFMLGIFTTRTSAAGGLTGAAVSTIVLGWVTWSTDLNFYLYPVVGILTCVVVGYCASFFLPRSRKSLDGLTWSLRDR